MGRKLFIFGAVATLLVSVCAIAYAMYAPTNIILSSYEVNENMPGGTPVATITATDADAGDTFTYSLVSGTGSEGNANFVIAGNQLKTSKKLNFEVKSEYGIRIRAKDSKGLTLDKQIIIKVKNTNDYPVIFGPEKLTTSPGVYSPLSGIKVSDEDGGILKVSVVAENGKLKINPASGLTVEGNDTANIKISGTVNILNQYLPSLNYNGSTPGEELTITVNDGSITTPYRVSQTGKFYSPENGHYYEYVSAPKISWISARIAASQKSMYGLQGYLVTITSQAEHDFVISKLSNNGAWMGLTDENQEGVFKWADGPEAGQTLIYKNWNSGEPNNLAYPDSQTGEDYVQFIGNGVGLWNDLRNQVSDSTGPYGIAGYVVEYGGDGFGGEIPAEAKLLINLVDTTPPTAPGEIKFSNTNDTSSTLNWAASTDNIGVVGYDIYRGTALIGTTTQTTYNVTGLTAKTSYNFTIKAKDAAGNISASSKVATLTTTAPDITPPTAPTGLNASAVTTTSLVLSWTESTDNVGVTKYEIYQGESLIGETSGNQNTYSITGLNIGTNYIFTVKAKDAAGNISPASTPLGVTTLDPTNLAPTAINLSGNTVDENHWIGYEIGTLTSVDPNGEGTFVYSLVDGEGDTDNKLFSIEGDKLKVASELKFVDEYMHSIRVRTTDSGGLSYAQPLEIDITRSNVVLNDSYNQLTIFFKEKIYNNEVNPVMFKSKIKITKNAEAETPEYMSLQETDTVYIKSNTLIIKFNPPLPPVSANYRIQILGGALKDISENKSLSMITSPFYVNGEGPKITAVAVGKTKKIITISLNKSAYIASEGLNSAAKLTAFKNSFLLKRAGEDYLPLGAKDGVKVSGKTVTISLSKALTGSGNYIKIGANNLRDLGGNKSGELTARVDLDTTGPTIGKVRVSGKNKVIYIYFKDGAFIAYTGTNKATLLKNAISISGNAGITYRPLGENDSIELVKGYATGLLIITLNDPISGKDNRVRIATDALKDSFKNLNTALETSSFAADMVAPGLISGVYQAYISANTMNKTVIVNFNEGVYNGSKAATKALKATDLRNSVTYTLDADAVEPVYAPLPSTAKIGIRGKQLRILFAKSMPASKNFKIRIAEGIVIDLVGNSAGALETEKFAVDKTGPKLR